MRNTKSKKLQKKPPERLYYIDVLNIFACFFVVLLHCTGVIFNYENSVRWCIAAALNSITRSAVPVFVTITGITLLEYRSKYNTETFFKKRFLRTLVPFVIWSVIYVIWNAINAGNGFPSAGDFMTGIMNCKATNVFWFFYLLFGLYLSIPVLSLIAEKKNEKIIYYYAALCILVNGFIPFYNYFSPYKLSGNFTIPIASGYIIYLLFGYILKNESYKREIRLAVYIVGVLTVLVTFFGTVYISKKAGKSESLFFDCSVIPMSFAYTLFAKHMWKLIEKKNASDATPPRLRNSLTRLKRILPTVSGASLGVYLIHIIIMKYFNLLPFVDSSRIRYMFYAPFAIYGISLLIVLAVKKIPFIGNKIFP